MGDLTLFLSPHLDDAVLSCPVSIQRSRAVIATVFSEGPVHQLRREEDHRAADTLGARVLHLGFTDAPFRSEEYRSFEGILFSTGCEYTTAKAAVAAELADTVGALGPARVLAPLAVGNHVDHRLVRDAALASVPPDLLWWYEDRPYSFIPEQVAQVLGNPPNPLPPGFWNRYFDAAYVRTWLGSADRESVMRRWLGVLPFPPPGPPALESELLPTEAETRRAIAAIGEYRSQTPALFDGLDHATQLYRRAPERLYRLA